MLTNTASSSNEPAEGNGPLEPDVGLLSPEELEEEIAELCVHIDAATYRLLRAIGELDRREAWAPGFQSVAHWLSWRVGIDLVTARQKVRVARALENLPRIREAFRQGKLSYSKGRAMSRIATPETESYLLYIAENGTACHMERLVRSYQRVSRAEDPEEARRQREDRYLEIYPDDDGMVIIRGRLPREVAALLEKALEAAMDALNQEEPGPVIPTQSGIPQHQSGTPDPAELHNPCSGAAPEAIAKSRNQSRGTGTHDSAESCTPGVVPAEAGIREHQIDLQLPKSFLASRTRPVARPADDSAESSASSGPADPACPERAARFALSPGGGWAGPAGGNHIRSPFTWIRQFLPTKPMTASVNWRTETGFQAKRAGASHATPQQ
jgi:hypothetical protein